MKRILVLGSNFSGVTAAISTKRKLGNDVEVIVISPTSHFLYVPSLIWVPFGVRKVKDITFPVEPMLNKKGVKFIQDKGIKVIPDQNKVITEKNGELSYDYLIVATGASLNFDILPNLNPKDNMIQCIVTPDLAEKSAIAFEEIVKNPGPVVVAATQGASCMGAAYEYLFNLDKYLRKRGVRKQVDITWVTPEPFLGAEVMKNSPDLVDEKGFVVTNDGYQHIKYKNVYAAGLAVEVITPFKKCAAPFGVPKTGFPSDVMGKIVAENIRNDIKGTGKFKTMPFGKIPGICIMDAGKKEVWILTNHLFKPRQFELMIPNVFYNFGKLILEKYMLWKNKKGLVQLP